MKRACVVGSGGAGKSTFSRRLGDLLGIEVVHLDALFWLPGWVQREREQFDELVKEALAKDAWVMDGNYNRTQPLRFPASDTIIFLDYPGWLCLYRVLKRWWVHRGQTRPDMGLGCPESIDAEFLLWVWRFRRRSRPALLRHLGEHGSSARLFHLRRPRDAERMLRELAGSDAH
jgi:adenylate kinase family enzyme